MELIHLLLNSLNGEMCFLCLKESVATHNIQSNLEVKSQFIDKSLSLADMINYLFPAFELIVTKSCEDCTDLVISMYTKIHRNNVMKTIINNITDTINKQITNNNITSLRKLDITINLSKVMDVTKCNEKYDLSNISDESHDENVTNKLDEQSFTQENQCADCFKLFDCVKKYKTHIKSHKQSRKKVYYGCNKCNYKSPCKQSLQGHINKNHLKVRPHICNVCFKDFYHRKNLVEHNKRHLDVRNEVCDVCGDSFIHKKNLLEHLKLHSGQKPYCCEVCDRRFITSGRRLEQVKRCHRQKNECCLLCDKKFSLIKELTRHIKAVHS